MKLVERIIGRRSAWLAGTLCVIALPALAEPTVASRIEAITLSSGGLAQIHRSARIAANGGIRIDAPLEQVDDILKSLVVSDPAGKLVSVTLDGLSPVEETFRRLPFSPQQMASLPDLVGTLQGVALTAASGGRSVTGTVLGIAGQDGGAADGSRSEHVLTVMNEEGQLEVLRMGADTVVEILDETMTSRLRDAAAVSGRGRTDDLRAVTIAMDGKADRTVALSYVVSAPVWKTAYRLLTGERDKARLQAWAVLENASGEDWNEVSVTLSSGAPVALAQQLHQRYWHQRPHIPVMAQASAPPRPDRARGIAVGQAAGAAGEQDGRLSLAVPEAQTRQDVLAPAPPAHRAAASEGETMATYRLGEPISLAAGRTISLPFIDTQIEAERVSLFQPDRGLDHPVAAIRVDNTTMVSLPAGIVTVYDGQDGYAGDAQLTGIPAGESRMISFAADRKVEVTTQARPEEVVERVSISGGVLRSERVTRQVTDYIIQGASDAARTVLIEHPRRPGWQVSSDDLESQTPSHHRLRVRVAADQGARVQVLEQRREGQGFRLVDADLDALVHWSGRTSDAATSARLRELADLRRQASEAQHELSDIDEAIERAASDQARIRDNLAAVPPESGLGQRYVDMLAHVEDRIGELNLRRKQAEARLDRSTKAVETFIERL